MNKPQRNWKVIIIHHTHTDIGYTDSQGRIARYHVRFLDRVVEIADQIRKGDRDLEGFCWTNECFWSVEEWLKARPPGRHDSLVQAIHDGIMELSGTYLHFNELADERSLRRAIGRARAFADRHGLPLDSAVSADINGFGWGYAQALHDAGIHNLVTCVHEVHGLAPIGKRQAPFFWETPGGQEILVWNGEHYNLGNVMGLCPMAAINYSFTDEIITQHRVADTMPLALVRLPRYLKQLEQDGYPYDFVPLHVSGATTDNAPPSEAVIRFIKRWNAEYPDSIRLEMSSPSDLCRRVRAYPHPIPRHRGDWPDWWSDGFISVPAEVRLAREAQRTLSWLETRGGGGKLDPILKRMEDNVLLFCEHTYNHSGSIKAPWDIEVKAVGGNKRAYAIAAFEAAVEGCDAFYEDLGAMPNLAPTEDGGRFVYRVYNPMDIETTDMARVFFDNKDDETLQISAEVVDAGTGLVKPSQKAAGLRGTHFDVPLSLPPGGSAFLELRTCGLTLRSSIRSRDRDVAGAEARQSLVRADGIETGHFSLRVCQSEGLTSLVHRASGSELISPRKEYGPFVPVYEVTPSVGHDGESMRKARGFGCNRKGEGVRRSAGVLRKARIVPQGVVSTTVELEYSIAGVNGFTVLLSVWHGIARVDATVRLHKQSVWEPENLYLSLPFELGGAELWVDKAGARLRPWRDQLPDTLSDWTAVQEGFAFCRSGLGLAVATPDSPLLQLGPLAYGKRRLMGHPDLETDRPRLYAWLMTNYWGTNFDAETGGFHEFRYRLECGSHLADPGSALRHCRALNCGLKTFRIRPEPGGEK